MTESGDRIAIIGAGQTGCLTANALLEKGYDVTLYSDKTPDQFLNEARPTGTAARFNMALDWERELGLEMWGDEAPNGEGIHLHFCPEKDNRLLTLCGRVTDPFLAIDLRLQSATWMKEFDERGGTVHIEQVSIDRLEEIAAENDLTMTATGKGEIGKIFPRDEERSNFSEPQRYLAMVNVTGIPAEVPYAPLRPVKFNFFAPYGEMFWVPWFSKDGKRSWSCLFEAKTGGPIDRFRDVSSGEEALSVGKQTMQDMTPWDYEWLKDAELCDENSWLTGTFTPQVKDVVGTLPSGDHVMALGDTCHLLDPIGGQGANNANKMARVFVDCIEERGDGPFDPDWMRRSFDRFWERHGKHIELFNKTLLEPLTDPGKLLLTAQYGSTGRTNGRDPRERLADRFCDNFNDPKTLTGAFHDDDEARDVIREIFGSTFWPLMKGRFGIGYNQIRQKLGFSPRHPA